MAQIDPIIIASTHLESPKRGKHPALSMLKRGEVVEGRVVRAFSPNRAILLIKGRQLVATTPLPLRADGAILFRVEQVVPECVLRLLQVRPDQSNGLASLIKGSAVQRNVYQYLIDLIGPLTTSSHISSKQRLPEILRQMVSLIRRISIAAERPPDQQFLKSLIDNSGLVWENKLKSLVLAGLQDKSHIQALLREDLKGLALVALEDEGTKHFVASDGLTKFVDSIEQFQLANLIGLEEKGKLLLTFPMQWDDVFRFAQLLIDLPGKGKEEKGGDKKALLLSLFLDMSRLGPIRIDASVHERSIRLCFLVCSEEVQFLLNSFAEYLKSQLERHGFSVPQIACRVEQQSLLEKTAFVDALIDFEEHRVSVMV